jgi:hypothetical protein
MNQQTLYKPVLGAIALGSAGVAIAHYTGKSKAVVGGICAVGGFVAGYLMDGNETGRTRAGNIKAQFKKVPHPKYQIFEVVADKNDPLPQIFLRPQEYYDNKTFKNKIFTISEIGKWYEGMGDFSMYGHGSGFNAPDYAFKKFLDGSFNPLSAEEEWLLSNIRQSVDFNKPYYIIGYYNGVESVRKHELAHALYYLSPEYRREANKVLSGIDSNPAFSILYKFLKDQHYDKSVYLDEAHAYIIGDKNEMIKRGMWNEKYEPYYQKLNSLFDLYFYSHN